MSIRAPAGHRSPLPSDPQSPPTDAELSSGIRPSPARRIVLYPYGPPTDPLAREICAAQLVRSGGDPDRTFDDAPGSLNRFVERVQRIPAVCNAPGSIIVITQTDPLALAVVATRRRIEGAVAALKGALWVVYASDNQLRRLLSEMVDYGTLTGPLSIGPIWATPAGESFLILSSQVRDEIDLARRALACGAIGLRRKSYPGQVY
jgi:hypothetical protein